tara:strand:- start:195 stop:410 length:216 start_codon:yes stop_codon:yes gene_type:complete
MKSKDIKQLHTQTIGELKEAAEKVQAELARLRIDLGLGKIKDTHQLSKKQRDLARIKTILRDKEFHEALAR